MPDAERFDAEAALRPLKKFQRRTVDYVMRRFYQDSDATMRFLVADEVGLGKTMVARGVIACAIERLWDSVERIDVLYICSNQAIAGQNINRLNVLGKEEFELPTRMTLLPLQLAGGPWTWSQQGQLHQPHTGNDVQSAVVHRCQQGAGASVPPPQE